MAKGKNDKHQSGGGPEETINIAKTSPSQLTRSQISCYHPEIQEFTQGHLP